MDVTAGLVKNATNDLDELELEEIVVEKVIGVEYLLGCGQSRSTLTLVMAGGVV